MFSEMPLNGPGVDPWCVGKGGVDGVVHDHAEVSMLTTTPFGRDRGGVVIDDSAELSNVVVGWLPRYFGWLYEERCEEFFHRRGLDGVGVHPGAYAVR